MARPFVAKTVPLINRTLEATSSLSASVETPKQATAVATSSARYTAVVSRRWRIAVQKNLLTASVTRAGSRMEIDVRRRRANAPRSGSRTRSRRSSVKSRTGSSMPKTIARIQRSDTRTYSRWKTISLRLGRTTTSGWHLASSSRRKGAVTATIVGSLRSY